MKKSQRKQAGAVTRSTDPSHDDALFTRVVDLIEAAHRHVARSVTYPEGSALPTELGGPAKRSAALSISKPEKIRAAALPSVLAASKICSAAPSESRRASPRTKSAAGPAPFPPHLGWTHDLLLMRVANPTARVLRARGRARELVDPGAGAADRVAPVRAAKLRAELDRALREP